MLWLVDRLMGRYRIAVNGRGIYRSGEMGKIELMLNKTLKRMHKQEEMPEFVVEVMDRVSGVSKIFTRNIAK